MKAFTITHQNSHADIRDQLKTFGFLSGVEASIDNKDSGIIHLREVGLGERLLNFVSRTKGGTEENKSRDALLKLAEINPAVGKLLGQSLFEKNTWSASDLRQGLKVQEEIDNSSVSKKQLTNPDKLGVANVMIDRVKADTEISWSRVFSLPASAVKIFNSENSSQRNFVSVLSSMDFDFQSEKQAYRTALSSGQDHVVLTPIHPSNESIDCLFEVIDELNKGKTENEKRRITIAAGEHPGLAEKVWARKAAHDHELARKSAWAGDKVPMPPALFAIQADQKIVFKPSGTDIDGKTQPTQIHGVSWYCGSPAKIASAVSILRQSEIVERANELRSEGKPRLHDVCHAVFFSPGLVAEETTAIMKEAAENWGLQAVELPSPDLPAERLIAIGFLNNKISTIDAEDFFKVHLQDVSGRVVIELTGNADIDQAALNVAKYLQQANPNTKREIIFASSIQAVIDNIFP